MTDCCDTKLTGVVEILVQEVLKLNWVLISEETHDTTPPKMKICSTGVERDPEDPPS